MPLVDKKIESVLAPLGEKYPEYRFERTGMFAVGRDEMDSVGPQTIAITMIALVIIFLMLIWNFRSPVTPLLALIPIVVGIVWSMGIIALTIGSMNIFTVMIGVVLLGLGIDFSIHLMNRFHEELDVSGSVEQALRLSLGETGVGVITGAVTTAVAFFTLMIADTKGIKEFGFCAGVGVMATLAAVIVLLPALLAGWAERRKLARSPSRIRWISGCWESSLSGWDDIGWASSQLVSSQRGLDFWSGTRLDWEWNWMKLEPEGLRSVELQDEIIDRFKLSVSMSMLTADSVEDSRRLRKEFKEKRVVGEVDDLSLWVSRTDFDQTRTYIEELRGYLGADHPTSIFVSDTDGAPDRRAMLAEELDRLWANIVEIQALSFTGGQDRVVEKTRQIVATRDDREGGLLRHVADGFREGSDIVWGDFNRFSSRFHREMSSRARRMADGEGAVTLDMVPEDIAAKYVSGRTSGFLMHVYPKKNLFEREDLEIFRDVASRVHPNVTGFPQMFLLMNLETIREGKLAFFAAVGVIFLVLLLDFKRPLIAVLAFLPLVSGIALTLGVLWLLDEKLNYLNVIALPVIIGIGVDDGVHFFHRYLQEGEGGLRRAVTSVGRAMLMTSLTTMIGFGSLMLYLMRGMASLGLVLFVGVGLCFVVTITLLPALAKVFENRIFKAA